ncbi:Ras-related protein RabA1d [Tanacetum coccineum]
MARGKDHDYVYPVVLIGDAGVGKSNMLSRFFRKEFKRKYEPTVAVEFQSQNISVHDKIIRAQFWDVAGEERFQPFTGAYVRLAAGAMIVYDITRTVTFENVERWLRKHRDHGDPNIVVMLVRNKTDLSVGI